MRQLAVIVLILACGLAPAMGADEVTIYRCTDNAGRLTLRDTPCHKGQTQQSRNMVRPKDAPPARVARAPTPRTSDDSALPRVIYVNAPRPMYECTPPDGTPYVSDSDNGNPRFVPLWALGYPVGAYRPAGIAGSAELAIPGGNVRIQGRSTTLTPPGYGPNGYALGGYGPAYGGGTWVRDECHALPQDEVCSRLVDRRDEIGRRFFNAMPSERDVLRVEERGINARLDNDCGRQ